MSNNVNTQGNVKVPGRLKQTAIDEHGNLLPIAGASDIYDDTHEMTLEEFTAAQLALNEEQAQLNEELRNATSVAPARPMPYDDDFNGLEKIYLAKNIVVDEGTDEAHNYLTQEMMHKQNAIYIINYDFELAEDIIIPENCVLQFEGGSISGNGTGKDTLVCDTIISEKSCFANCIVKTPLYKTHWFNNKIVESIRSNNSPITIYQTSDILINTVTNSMILPDNSIFYGNKDYTVTCNGHTDGIHPGNNCLVKNVIFRGQGSPSDMEASYAEFGIACSSSNVTIDNCEFYGFYSDMTYCIHFRKGQTCSGITVKNCIFDGMGSIPEGHPGDANGACRAINIQGDYSDIHIYGNVFRNIMQGDDSDYICINKETELDAEKLYYDTINAIIENNVFYNSVHSSIKIFGSNVVICRNISKTIYNGRGMIRCYNSQDINIYDEFIKGDTCTLLGLESCKNVTIDKFIAVIRYSGSYGGHAINLVKSSDITINHSYVDVTLAQSPSYDRTSLINLSGCNGNININHCNLISDGALYGAIIAYIDQVDGLVLNINNTNCDFSNAALNGINLYSGGSGKVNILNSNIENISIISHDLTIQNSKVSGSLSTQGSATIINSIVTKIVSYGSLFAKDLHFDDVEKDIKIKLYKSSELHNVYYNGTIDGEYCRLLDLRNFNTTEYVVISGLIGNNIRYKDISYVVVNSINVDRIKYLPFADTNGINRGITRPSNPIVGQMFFDTTNGIEKPIWYKGSNVWVDATGATV